MTLEPVNMGSRLSLTSFTSRFGLIPVAASTLLALVPHPGGAQVSEPSSVRALRIGEAVDVDGWLAEEAWGRAQHVSNFTQRELNFGELASERTEVAVLYDAEALYVGFWGFDREPGRIFANQMARDFSWSGDDCFELVLDPFNDDRNGYLFVTNPNGAMADALIAENGGSTNRDWDGVWEVRTQVTEEGWFAEIRIPFSTLRFGPRPEEGWGVNFERNIRRKREQVLWQGWSRDFDLEQVSRAGTLTGLAGLGSVGLVDVRPHALGGVEWDEGEDRSSVGHLGLDVHYLPSPAWRFNFTVNPDFAQVESDREEVNLSRFSLFYPEKRDFFLEGQEFFAFEISSDSRPFYSRRIGLAEDRTEVPILGGGRALGKWGGTTLGAMVLQTAEDGGEPSTNFGVMRWKQDVLDESAVGALLVSRLEPGRQNFTYGVDLAYATSEMFDEKEFEAGLVVARTYTSDAENQTGLAHRLYFGYPNDLVEFSGSWTRADESFDPEVGYVRRSSYQRFGSELAILPRPRFLPFIQQFEFKPFEFSYFMDDVTHELQSFYAEVVPLAFETRGGESFEFKVERHGEGLEEPFELFEDAEIPEGEYWYTRWAVELGSFSGRRVSGDLEMSGGDFYLGEQRNVSVSGRWKTGKHLTLAGDYEHNRIALFGDEFLVDELGARADFAFTPTLFGAVAGQWNSEDEEVILNFRINWIPRPGSDLFLVVNQQAETWESRWNPTHTAVLTKLVWRMAF
jgi:hypothetical protein